MVHPPGTVPVAFQGGRELEPSAVHRLPSACCLARAWRGTLGAVGPCRACAPCARCLVQRGLTGRSRRGPTALHQARDAPRHIMRVAGLAQCRWSRLTSNVRPHRRTTAEHVCRQTPISLALRPTDPCQRQRSSQCSNIRTPPKPPSGYAAPLVSVSTFESELTEFNFT